MNTSHLTWAVWAAVIGQDDWVIACDDALYDGSGQYACVALIVDTGVNVA